MNRHFNQIIQNYHENRLSHAFLIETNDQETSFNDLKEILCQINCESKFEEMCQKCNLCHLIRTEQIPSLVVIRPDGMNIKKDQVLDLKQNFSTKPLYSKYNMYVVLNAEKLNASSANTLLKFIEEPEAGILGFFITNNKENIIDTIRSRCQILSNFYEGKSINNEQLRNIAIKYLQSVHITDDFSLTLNKEFLEENDLSKNDYQNLFQEFTNIYYALYKASIYSMDISADLQNLNFLLKKDSTYFLRQLKLVEKLETELGYNVNINLVLDRFVLETRS